ncbi:MAG TPA: hypothetical protein VI094_15355 [Propionibacteriaceae bacterium]
MSPARILITPIALIPRMSSRPFRTNAGSQKIAYLDPVVHVLDAATRSLGAGSHGHYPSRLYSSQQSDTVAETTSSCNPPLLEGTS